MKALLTSKNIFILIGFIYCISVVERHVLKQDHQTDRIIQHKQEKLQMQTKISTLNNQIHKYEIQILKNNAGIDSLSNDQLDSVWSNLFNSR